MAIEIDVPTHLNMRIDPKLRYLTEIAARSRSMTLTEYIEATLRESFAKVTVNEYAEFDDEENVGPLSPEERIEKLRHRASNVSNPLSAFEFSLWSPNPLVRLQLIATLLPHLMSNDDKRIWSYIFSRPELVSSEGKLNHKRIEDHWSQIKGVALAVKPKVKAQ